MAKNKFNHILRFVDEIQHRKERVADFLRIKLIVDRNVFPVDSGFSFSSKIVAKAIPKNPGRVLDIGTGTGVQAITAAKKGATEVLAVDIDSAAIDNAKKNVKFHKLENIIEVRKSNLLSKVKKSEKFNLIVANLPFADADYAGKFSHFLFDKNLRLHEQLLKAAKTHLTKDGKLLMAGGDISNEALLIRLAKKYGYAVSITQESKFNGFNWKSYFLIPKM